MHQCLTILLLLWIFSLVSLSNGALHDTIECCYHISILAYINIPTDCNQLKFGLVIKETKSKSCILPLILHCFTRIRKLKMHFRFGLVFCVFSACECINACKSTFFRNLFILVCNRNTRKTNDMDVFITATNET